MLSYRLKTIGSIDGLELCEEPVPTPGAGEVLVRARACSLNFRDLAILQGWMPFGVEAGRILLSDAAGSVEAVGPGVTRFRAGDWVINSTMPNWFGGRFREFPQQYGLHLDGWLCEYRGHRKLNGQRASERGCPQILLMLGQFWPKGSSPLRAVRDDGPRLCRGAGCETGWRSDRG